MKLNNGLDINPLGSFGRKQLATRSQLRQPVRQVVPRIVAVPLHMAATIVAGTAAVVATGAVAGAAAVVATGKGTGPIKD